MELINNSEDVWGPIGLNDWENILFIKNRIATEEDVKLGRAVFYIESVDHTPIDIQIPSLAYQVDKETGEKKLVIVIQAETTGEEEVVGIRYFEGGNGVCMLHELEFTQDY
jgi:hypothetical protein